MKTAQLSEPIKGTPIEHLPLTFDIADYDQLTAQREFIVMASEQINGDFAAHGNLWFYRFGRRVIVIKLDQLESSVEIMLDTTQIAATDWISAAKAIL